MVIIHNSQEFLELKQYVSKAVYDYIKEEWKAGNYPTLGEILYYFNIDYDNKRDIGFFEYIITYLKERGCIQLMYDEIRKVLLIVKRRHDIIQSLSHEIFDYLWIEWALGNEPNVDRLCYDFGFKLYQKSIDINEALLYLHKSGLITLFRDKKNRVRRIKRPALIGDIKPETILRFCNIMNS